MAVACCQQAQTLRWACIRASLAHRCDAAAGAAAAERCPPANQGPPCCAQRLSRWCAIAKGGGTKKPSRWPASPPLPPRYGESGASLSRTASTTSVMRWCGSGGAQKRQRGVNRTAGGHG
mgnify:CR=1 FL=1